MRGRNKRIETFSPVETFTLGESFGKEAVPGTVYTLDGDLGCGKTLLTQGLAKGLGISGSVVSPTFTILQVYEKGRLPLYHFDVYRIADPDEMDEIGFDEYLYGNGVCVIEWSKLIDELIPDTAVRLTFERDLSKGADYRLIICT